MWTCGERPVNGREIILYGAGFVAQQVIDILARLSIVPSFCVARSGDKLKYGDSKEMVIYRPDILHKSKHFVFITSTRFAHEMSEQLKSLGYSEGQDYLVWDFNDYSKTLPLLLKLTTLTKSELNDIIYRSCRHLQNSFILLGSALDDQTMPYIRMQFCCMTASSKDSILPFVEYSGSSESIIDEVADLKTQLIEQIIPHATSYNKS